MQGDLKMVNKKTTCQVMQGVLKCRSCSVQKGRLTEEEIAQASHWFTKRWAEVRWEGAWVAAEMPCSVWLSDMHISECKVISLQEVWGLKRLPKFTMLEGQGKDILKSDLGLILESGLR